MSLNSTTEDTAGREALIAAAVKLGFKPRCTKFLFLRHGRTAGNIGRIYQHPDIPLATEGFVDADLAAEALRDVEFDRIYASDMARAWLTAGRVAVSTGRPVQVCKALRERYFGDFIGTSSLGLDWRVDPPNGETMLGFVERTLRGIEEILDHRELSLLVSHGGVLRVLSGALDIDLPVTHTVNALPMEIECRAGKWHATPMMPLPEVQELGAA